MHMALPEGLPAGLPDGLPAGVRARRRSVPEKARHRGARRAAWYESMLTEKLEGGRAALLQE